MKIKKTALILFILLLLISLAATPLWALSSETSAQTTGEAFEELTDPPFSDELGTAGDHGENETRSNDEIVSATYLEDGVYAFRNVGNGNFWMDVRANNYTTSTNMQQYYTTTLPTDSFERSLLFKITRNETTNRYVIRLMLNNRLTFDFSGNNVMTKVIPAKDSEVAAVDTFAITRSGSGYTIRPNDSSYLVSANSSQASGSAGAPDSNLVKKTPTAAGNCGIWELHRYTGTSRSGFSVSMSPTIPDGLAVGDHTLVSFATWSTVADANTPHLEVSSAYSSRASVTLQSTNSDFLTKYQVKAEKAGKFELTYRIKNASGGNAYSSYQMYMAIPDIDAASFYIQNGATGRYMDVEGPSTAEGAYIQQWDFSTAPQKQWTVTPVGGGYYSIKSNYSQRYVGVDSQNTANIRQYSALNDYTKWYFQETNSGRYAIHCKMWSVTGVLAGQSDTSGNGSDLTTSVYTNDSSYRDEWGIYSTTLRIVNYYDNSFSNNTAYIQAIEGANEFVSEVLKTFFNIDIVMENVPNYWSTAYTNQCLYQNSPCNSFCGTDCDVAHHKNLDVILSDIKNYNTINDSVVVVWMDRPDNVYCIESSGQHQIYYAIAAGRIGEPYIETLSLSAHITSTTEYEKVISSILLHEIVHCFGYRDVYGTTGHQLTYACIMDYYNEQAMKDFYDNYDIRGISPFCSNCLSGITAKVEETAFWR